MKSLMIFFALNAIKFSQQLPVAGGVGVSGGFVKQGGFAVGPAEGYVDGVAGGGGTASGGVSGGGSFGAVFGGAGNIGGGEVVKTVTVEKHVAPAPLAIGAVGGGSLSLFGGGVGKHYHAGRAEVISEKVLEVATEAPLPPAPAKKTVIERTFIPNYVEKRVQVPTYVEKTIRVPTYVEKTIKVPAAPTILEKTISQEEVPVPKDIKVEGAAIIPPAPVYDNVQVYTKVRARPHKLYHKEVITGGDAGYIGGGHGFGNGFGGGGFQAHVAGGGGGLLDGIFNIPVQALGATKEFLNNFSGGFSAQGGFAKGYSAY